MEEAAEEAERLRLYYVAMTRAIDRLIVAGSVDGERRDAKTPMGWVLDRLELGELEDGEVVRGEARLRVAVDRYDARGRAGSHRWSRRTTSSRCSTPSGSRPWPRFRRCPARARRRAAGRARAAALVHGARPVRELPVPLLRRAHRRHAPASTSSGRVPGQTGMAGTEIGSAVHRLLEDIDLASPVPPSLEEVVAWYPAATAEELGRIGGLVEAYCALAARRAAGGARRRGGRAAVRVRARRRPLPRVPRRAPPRRAAARSSPTTSRTRSATTRRPRSSRPSTGSSASCTRSPASGRAPRRSRSSTSSWSGPTSSVEAVFRREQLPELEAELSAAIARIQGAGSRRGRASGPAPGARRSTWSAPALR